VFDFRYHALSLVAVFVALVLGLLLGVAIGDSGLVSSAERDIRKSLRADVRRANQRADTLRAELEASQRYDREVYPLLVGGQLASERIGLVFLGNSDESIADNVKSALTDTGATVANVAVAREPLDRAALAARAQGTRYAALDADPGKPDLELVEAFGARMGAQYVAPGQLIRRVRATLFDAFNGALERLHAVVVVRNHADLTGTDARAAERFERGFVRGLHDSGMPIVGAEEVRTDPSQIRWYRDRDISSVDSVDRTSGRAALVFALQGAQGAFGIKPSAQALLPDVTGSSG
jgi:hypothetical protein